MQLRITAVPTTPLTLCGPPTGLTNSISSGPLRPTRTAARAADRPDHFGRLHLATALYTVTVHTRRMRHNGLHAGGMYWRGYNIPTISVQYYTVCCNINIYTINSV
jgi:hypothetical protein